jgi:hypothetical protein
VLEHLPHISTVNQSRRGIAIRYSEAAHKAVENAQLAGEWGFMRKARWTCGHQGEGCC